MKKVIIAAALVLSIGVLSSQTTVNNNTQPLTATMHAQLSVDKKDLASAD